MSDITEFLLARIAEDEEAWWYIHDEMCRLVNSAGNEACNCDHPQRVLAECEAKQRIVELYNEAYDNLENNWDEIYEGSTGALSDVVFTLAKVYADHSDYDPAWS